MRLSTTILGQTAPDFILQSDDGNMLTAPLYTANGEFYSSTRETTLQPAKEVV